MDSNVWGCGGRDEGRERRRERDEKREGEGKRDEGEKMKGRDVDEGRGGGEIERSPLITWLLPLTV